MLLSNRRSTHVRPLIFGSRRDGFPRLQIIEGSLHLRFTAVRRLALGAETLESGGPADGGGQWDGNAPLRGFREKRQKTDGERHKRQTKKTDTRGRDPSLSTPRSPQTRRTSTRAQTRRAIRA